MMRSLLCWCICLLVVAGSPLSVVGGWWPVVGTNLYGGKLPNRASHTTQIPKKLPTDHRPPTTDHLPCSDSSSACLQTLGDLAVQNSRGLAVLKQAIQLQKKKRWTSWLSADGLHPLAIGLRIARNLAGGGDRAAAQLELSHLELRQAELEHQLRQAVTRAALEVETAERQAQDAERKLTTQQVRVALYALAYRFGEGNTETMLQLWQRETELQQEVEAAHLARQQRRLQLESLVLPATNQSQKAKAKSSRMGSESSHTTVSAGRSGKATD